MDPGTHAQDSPLAHAPSPDLADPRLYTNRELSWLEFNQRVLAEAQDERNPLLERVRFLAITANNLDEFFMIRVSGLRQQVRTGVNVVTPDGMTPREQVDAVHARTRQMLGQIASCLEEELRPALAAERVPIRGWDELDNSTQAKLSAYFRERIFPVLTPLAVDPAHPFPYISNLSLNLAVLVHDAEKETDWFARVKVPTALLGRFVRLPDREGVIPIETLVSAHLAQLFPGMEIRGCHAFRVIRDADLEIEDDEAGDLLSEIEASLQERRFGSVISIQIQPGMPDRLRRLLEEELELAPGEVVEMPGMLGVAELSDLFGLVDRPDLGFPTWKPRTPARLIGAGGEPVDLFALLRNEDVLVHFPYDSFASSVEAFILAAVHDPAVLAIKQTVYRTTESSTMMAALARAAEAGKQVVVVVEIKARFDEERNIYWARKLEDAGAHVAYGVLGLKTHAKAALVVRQEGDEIRRYVHIGTGNYNGVTARLYEDLGLLSTRPELGADLSDLFNYMTGYSRQRDFRKLCAAPYGLREAITQRIEREIAHARAGRAARLILKMNSLVDARMIAKLYEASQAGVEVDLIVRGICCLRPGIPGVSDHIRVRSLIGRFLEHSRIFHFHNDGQSEYLIGSADLMPRNLDRRVEAAAPVEDGALQARLQHILELSLQDDRLAWQLIGDSWTRLDPADAQHPRNTHEILVQEAIERSHPLGSP